MVVAGAMTLTSVFGGVAFAGETIEIGVGELQECTISKSMDTAPAPDGVDILIWQKAPSLTSEEPTEDAASYYNRIAFQYAATGDSRH
jgi:hypothetical protein